VTAAILDLALARAARRIGAPSVLHPWRPPLADLDSTLGFRRGDRVLLPFAPGLTGTIERIFPDPRTGLARAHVLTPLAHASIPVAQLRHAAPYL